MTHKTHLQANVGQTRAPMALCSTQHINVDPTTGRGQVISNGRRSYITMGSPIVKLDVFKTTPAHDRCAHCCAELLIRRNRIRKAEGKTPINAYDEGWA